MIAPPGKTGGTSGRCTGEAKCHGSPAASGERSSLVLRLIMIFVGSVNGGSRLVRFAVGAFAVVVGFGPVSVATRAAIACQNGSFQHYFDGNRSNILHTWAAQGRIRDRPINLCLDPGNTDDDSGAAIWVMVAGYWPDEYAQAGYARLPGFATRAFTESDDGAEPGGHSQVFHNGIWVSGAQHTYTVSYSAQTAKLHFQIDGVSKGSTSWSPDVVWHAPWEGQFYSESLDSGDDVPGTAGARADWSLLKVQTTLGTWKNPDGQALTSDLAAYKNGWTTWPVAFQTWTSR